MRPLEPFSRILRLARRLVGRVGSVIPGIRGAVGDEQEPGAGSSARRTAAVRTESAPQAEQPAPSGPGPAREAADGGGTEEGGPVEAGPEEGGPDEGAPDEEAGSGLPGAGVPYEEWTKSQLYERAKALDISGRSGMTKDELVEALRSA
jgi:hypothetical protein